MKDGDREKYNRHNLKHSISTGISLLTVLECDHYYIVTSAKLY